MLIPVAPGSRRYLLGPSPPAPWNVQAAELRATCLIRKVSRASGSQQTVNKAIPALPWRLLRNNSPTAGPGSLSPSEGGPPHCPPSSPRPTSAHAEPHSLWLSWCPRPGNKTVGFILLQSKHMHPGFQSRRVFPRQPGRGVPCGPVLWLLGGLWALLAPRPWLGHTQYPGHQLASLCVLPG